MFHIARANLWHHAAFAEKIAHAHGLSLHTFDRHDDAQAWAALKPAERNILALSAFDGLSVNELAVALEITPNTASQRLGRARKNFAEKLD